MQSVRLTLYDFFGYLLPGAIVVVALVILVWSLYFPTSPVILMIPSKQLWIVAAVVAYFAGHLVQGVGNVVSRIGANPEESVFGTPASATGKMLLKAARMQMHSCGFDGDIDAHWMFKLCDETVVQTGVVSDREVYVYREGFYRGTSVALALLTAALLLRDIRVGAMVTVSGSTVLLSRSLLSFASLISAAGTVLAFIRFKRFADHRVTRALAGFLVLQKFRKEEKGKPHA